MAVDLARELERAIIDRHYTDLAGISCRAALGILEGDHACVYSRHDLRPWRSEMASTIDTSRLKFRMPCGHTSEIISWRTVYTEDAVDVGAACCGVACFLRVDMYALRPDGAFTIYETLDPRSSALFVQLHTGARLASHEANLARIAELERELDSVRAMYTEPEPTHPRERLDRGIANVREVQRGPALLVDFQDEP